MKKLYNDFIEDVRKIRGFKNLTVTYNPSRDEISIYFTKKQWEKIDNENSKQWEKFSNLLWDYDLKHGFYCGYITVYEEN